MFKGKVKNSVQDGATVSSNGVKATVCPVSREQFRKSAKRALSVTIEGVQMMANYKEFETGSLGWFLNAKTVIDVDGVPATVQIGLNLTLVGSKSLPK